MNEHSSHYICPKNYFRKYILSQQVDIVTKIKEQLLSYTKYISDEFNRNNIRSIFEAVTQSGIK